MPPLALFGISIALSFIAWGIALARYVLPERSPTPSPRWSRPAVHLS